MITRRALALLFLAGVVANAKTADELMQTATAQASASNQNVLVVFHASWCGWCRKFETMLADEKVGPIMDHHFVVVRIDVQEHEEKVGLSTPGGAELMVKAGGKKAGLPFLAMFDRKGEPIVSSMRPDTGNIGYPAKPEEIDWFMTMLHRSAPAMDAKDSKTVEAWLKKHAR